MSERERSVKRERLLAAGLIFMFVAFIARLAEVQIFEHDFWSTVARGQSEKIVLQKPNRGEICDCNGIPLAVTLPLTYALGYRPKSGVDPELVATELAKYLPLTKTTLRSKLKSEGFVYLARRVDVEVKQKLDALKLSCLQFDEEPRRSYPSTSEAAAVIGFMNVDGKGQEGI